MFDKFLNYHVADNGTCGFDVPLVGRNAGKFVNNNGSRFEKIIL
jgi:hypothetical protein